MHCRKLFFLAITLCFSNSITATEQVIVEADQVRVDKRGQTSQYEGNVRVQKGNIEIDADRVEVQHKKNAISIVEAFGSPAKFRETENAAVVSSGTAKKLKYFLKERKIELRGNVEATQAGSRMQGESIDYDVENQLMHINSDEKKSKRVRIELDPEKLDAEP